MGIQSRDADGRVFEAEFLEFGVDVLEKFEDAIMVRQITSSA